MSQPVPAAQTSRRAVSHRAPWEPQSQLEGCQLRVPQFSVEETQLWRVGPAPGSQDGAGLGPAPFGGLLWQGSGEVGTEDARCSRRPGLGGEPVWGGVQPQRGAPVGLQAGLWWVWGSVPEFPSRAAGPLLPSGLPFPSLGPGVLCGHGCGNDFLQQMRGRQTEAPGRGLHSPLGPPVCCWALQPRLGQGCWCQDRGEKPQSRGDLRLPRWCPGGSPPSSGPLQGPGW